MLKFSGKLILLIVLLSCGCYLIVAQEKPQLGSMVINASKVTFGKDKDKQLKRKRFYLFPGSLDFNKDLIAKLKTLNLVSRDCFYNKLKATTAFIDWLKKENCESPYCRKISEEDKNLVPEFKTAYDKGLRQFGKNRSQLALNWLTTNLPPILSSGFYEEKEKFLEDLLGKLRPDQSTMIRNDGFEGRFIDIPLKLPNTGSTYLISNLLPVEIGDKSYIWACENDVSDGKGLRLSLPDKSGRVKECEFIVNDLPKNIPEDCK